MPPIVSPIWPVLLKSEIQNGNFVSNTGRKRIIQKKIQIHLRYFLKSFENILVSIILKYHLIFLFKVIDKSMNKTSSL